NPANINDLLVTSDSTGYANISFTSPGDENGEGRVYNYELNFYQEDQIVHFDYEFGQPLFGGQSENWIIGNLPQGQELTVQLQAFDESGNSNEITETTIYIVEDEIDEIAPATITNLSVQPLTESVLLTWTSVGDDENIGTAAQYIIRMSTEQINEQNWDNATEISQNIIPQVSGNQELMLIEDLEPNIMVYFGIKTIDEANNLSEISNIVSVIPIEPPDDTPPAAITNLSAQIVDETIALSWTSTGDDNTEGQAFQYDLRWANTQITQDNFLEANQIEDVANPQESGLLESYIFTETEVLIPYYFAIKAVDESDNWSTISNIIEIIIEEEIDEIPPAAITNLNATPTETEIDLDWIAVGDDNFEGQASQYDLRYSTEIITIENFINASQILAVQTPAESGTLENFTFTDCETDQIYYFAIKTIDEFSNTSSISNIANATIISQTDNIPPAAITDLYVLSGNSDSYSQISISFTATGDDENEGTADHYIIKYSIMELNESNWSLGTSFDNSIIPQTAGSTESITITGLNEGTLYYFAVVAVDETGNQSSISNVPAGKIVFAIDETACHDCGQCINDCDYGAISDAGNYKTIDAELCQACGDCSCPWDLIYLVVVGYND
ncbi:MAG: hypothetical protein U9N34_04550, partial [Candidatus Cloacimonadota bacterium]|nr:hypothetical protein [Candidatus Cloacimonadota bacterium]